MAILSVLGEALKEDMRIFVEFDRFNSFINHK